MPPDFLSLVIFVCTACDFRLHSLISLNTLSEKRFSRNYLLPLCMMDLIEENTKILGASDFATTSDGKPESVAKSDEQKDERTRTRWLPHACCLL